MNITLDNIARTYLFRKGKNTLHGYMRVMSHLIEFLRGLSMDYNFMFKTVELKLDEKKAVQLPEDFLTMSMIGWQDGDRVLLFQPDSRIALKNSYCEDVASATPNLAYSVYKPFPFNGSLSPDGFTNLPVSDGQLLGSGDNGLAYFRINWPAREIQLNANINGVWTIYLEYQSNGFNPKTKSSIPEFAQTPAEEYVTWKEAERKFGRSATETMACKAAYDKACYDMQARLDTLNYEGIVGARARATDTNKLVF